MVIDNINFSIQSVGYHETKEWLLHKHYAHRIPSISYAFGLYSDNVLVGICTFGIPASPSLVNGAFGGQYVDIFYELNRLVVNENLPRNALSFFVGGCLRMLPSPLIVVSYSDTSMHHHGYIYQATNFIYTGLSSAHSEYKLADIDNKHSRHLFDLYGGINSAKEQGIDMEVGQRARKHRYFYFIGNKRERKKMLKSLKYQVMPYPKGNNERYDASYQPTVQLTLF